MNKRICYIRQTDGRTDTQTDMRPHNCGLSCTGAECRCITDVTSLYRKQIMWVCLHPGKACFNILFKCI